MKDLRFKHGGENFLPWKKKRNHPFPKPAASATSSRFAVYGTGYLSLRTQAEQGGRRCGGVFTVIQMRFDGPEQVGLQ